MGMPRPPGAQANNNRATAQEPISFEGVSDGSLSEQETSVILQSILLPEHLNDQRILRFIGAYMRARDHKEAAREAGFHANAGLKLRNRPDIYQAIQTLTQKSAMKYGYDAHEVVERVKEITQIDPLDVYRADGSIKAMTEMDAPVRRAIKKMKVKELWDTDPNGMKMKIGEIIEIEFWDKLKASELLGGEKEIFKQKRVTEHTISNDMKNLLLESKSRAEQRMLLMSQQQTIDVTPVTVVEEDSNVE
jgi:hypothetical protein